MIQDTSLLSFQEIQSKLGASQKLVLDEITKEPSTNAEISERLGIPINRITPRTLELRTLDLVEDAGIVKCKATGRKAHLWQAKAYPRPFEQSTQGKLI